MSTTPISAVIVMKAKYLYLLRHAKSSWADITLPDWARLLNDRGKLDAPLMAKRMALQKIKPNLILSSPAVRAFETACKMANELNTSEESILIRHRIYEASTSDILNLLKETDDSINCLMLVGHNPALTELINRLGEKELRNLPTCAWVRFKCDCEHWIDIAECNVTWDGWDKPKLARKEQTNDAETRT